MWRGDVDITMHNDGRRNETDISKCTYKINHRLFPGREVLLRRSRSFFTRGVNLTE